LLALGAVGEIAAGFFDADGQAVIGSVDHRVIGLTLNEIRSIPQRIVVAFGRQKVPALRTALNA
jgi:DNA-binding transcriptional regulator LsrR (DeoR family)